MTDLKLDNETARDAILRVLGDVGVLRTKTLYDILCREFSARQMSSALTSLSNERLIETSSGRFGEYQLTEHGRAVAQAAPTPLGLDRIVSHPGREALDTMTGQLAIGTDVNGEDVHWTLWNSIGTRNCLAIGSSGAGGTNLLSGLVEATLPHYPHVRVWMIDDCRQMTEYWSQVEKVGTNHMDPDEGDVETVGSLLDQVLAVQADRARVLVQAGRKAWTGPFGAPRLPHGLLVIGVLSEVVGDSENRKKLAAILKMARKTGITVAAHTPTPLMDQFGYDLGIRDSFATGNLAMLRTSGPLFGQVIDQGLTNLPSIPAAFPNGATTAGVGHTGDRKLFRSFWTPGL